MSNNDFLFVGGWYDDLYEMKSCSRHLTFKTALNLFLQNGKDYILETGCVRLEEDYGAGYSTYIFGDFCMHYSKRLFTVDIDQTNMNVCRLITQEFERFTSYNVCDSIKFLEEFKDWDKVGLLYLDSLDADLDGGEPIEAQMHQRQEFLAIEDKLTSGTVLLLDDNKVATFLGTLINGKTKLVKEYLANKPDEWMLVLDYQQSVWLKR